MEFSNRISQHWKFRWAGDLNGIFIRSTALRSINHAKPIAETSSNSGANTRRGIFADMSMLLASICNTVTVGRPPQALAVTASPTDNNLTKIAIRCSERKK
jgi:hypothetical protein